MIAAIDGSMKKNTPTKRKKPSTFRERGWWRGPIDSFAPAHSPFGLPVYLARLPSARFSSAHGRARVGASRKQKPHRDQPGGAFVLATSYSRTAYRRTTIGAAAFHFRVRNGNGWCHRAIITRVRNRTGISLLSQRRKREAESLVTIVDLSKNCRFLDIYIQEVKANA